MLAQAICKISTKFSDQDLLQKITNTSRSRTLKKDWIISLQWVSSILFITVLENWALTSKDVMSFSCSFLYSTHLQKRTWYLQKLCLLWHSQVSTVLQLPAVMSYHLFAANLNRKLDNFGLMFILRSILKESEKCIFEERK